MNTSTSSASKLKVIFFGIIFSLSAMACAHIETNGLNEKKNLKYVFYFIGDGMAGVQVHATEAYRAALQENDTVNGGIKVDFLTMSRFPVQGMQTSFANNRLITGSAAAGTALACGMKTNIGTISKSPDFTNHYISIAETAKANGMKVGILSSVPINHATPAAFYAHTDFRKNYHDIAMQLVHSNFDFFGGGYWANSGEADPNGAEEAAVSNGFSITHTLDDLKSQPPGTPVIAFDTTQDAGKHTGALKYKLDRNPEDMSLAQFTEQAIRLLKNPNGFFMMVEGGKIDWACHANDARAAFEDIIAFDEAIKIAVTFAEKHPDETLIVVTGDHECGGLAIGHNDTKYDTHLETIANQTMSYEKFDTEVLPIYKAAHNPIPINIDFDMWHIILTTFGLDGTGLTLETEDNLTGNELERLESAFDATFHISKNKVEKGRMFYKKNTPLVTTLTRILNARAGLSWGSSVHTAVPVPVRAMGRSAELFSGFYDNTDIPKKIATALGVTLNN